MATISATQRIRTITPPSSSHGAGSWDYDNQQSNFPGDRSNQFDSRQPLSHSSYETRKMSYSSDTNAQRSTYGAENDHNVPRKINLNRKKSTIRHDSESEASLDMYKTTSANRSLTNGIEKSGKRKPSNTKLRTPEEDASNWIHRDKLAQIESKELEEAGFPVARMSRAGSRSAAGSAFGRHEEYEEMEPEYGEHRTPKNHDMKRQRVVSPVLDEHAHESEHEQEVFPFELRTPQEVAAELENRQYFHSPITKPNATRLPVPKQSPIPVPSIIMERDSPLARSRAGSGTGIELRPRSRSIHSAVLLDDDTPRTPVDARYPSASDESPSSSPPKDLKNPLKNPSSRKASASGQRSASGTSKYRNSSQQNRASPDKRPGTSSGRPSTSHRPEGDPPWLASMYKPDPRLPPDQQMLPTHARRLAQEKWEKEGKIGTAYDREFRLLNNEEIERPLSMDFSKIAGGNEEYKEQDKKDKPKPENSQINESKAWPLGSPLTSPGAQSASGSRRPSTSGTGKYTTMPKITSQPPVGTPATEKPQERIRLPEPKEDEKEKKGCCCIVM